MSEQLGDGINRQYVDIRDLMDGYKRVPCDHDDCDDYSIASEWFDPAEWPCRAHRPERLDVSHLTDSVTVRI